MRGRWHGGAVADEVGALASTRRCPPHQSPPATASPHRGSHWGACCRGGAYQDARKVSLVWNARAKHWDLPEFRCSMHPIVTKHSFLPYLFSCERKDRATGGASEMTTTERAAASDVSFPLCSFLPFQTASQTCGLGFIANLRQPLSLGCAEPASLPLLSLRDISP